MITITAGLSPFAAELTKIAAKKERRKKFTKSRTGRRSFRVATLAKKAAPAPGMVGRFVRSPAAKGLGVGLVASQVAEGAHEDWSTGRKLKKMQKAQMRAARKAHRQRR